jgi:hypothetical protein
MMNTSLDTLLEKLTTGDSEAGERDTHDGVAFEEKNFTLDPPIAIMNVDLGACDRHGDRG